MPFVVLFRRASFAWPEQLNTCTGRSIRVIWPALMYGSPLSCFMCGTICSSASICATPYCWESLAWDHGIKCGMGSRV